MRRVFISYSIAERHIAERLAADLTQSGHTVLPADDVVVGDTTSARITRILRRAKSAIILLSPTYVESEQARTELEEILLAESKARTQIVPVLVKDITLPAFLRGRDLADLQSDYEGAVASIKKALASPPTQLEHSQTRRRALSSFLSAGATALVAGIASTIIGALSSLDDGAVFLSENRDTILIAIALIVVVSGLVAVFFSLYTRFRHRSAAQEALARGVQRIYLESLDASSLNPASTRE